MSDLILQYEVFLQYWKELIQKIESVKLEEMVILRQDQLNKFKEEAILILEECFSSEAGSYLTIIQSSTELRKERKMSKIFDITSLLAKMESIEKEISKKCEKLKRRQEIQSKLNVQSIISSKKHEEEASVPVIISNRIFLVHGRDNEMVQHVARIVRKLGLEPIILHEQRNKGRTIIEKFEEESSDVGFALILLSPDDEGRLRGTNNLNLRARQNVIFEHGFFIGKLGRERVGALYRQTKDFKKPSDIDGVLYIPYKPDSLDWAYSVCEELKEQGYTVSKDNL